MDYFSGEQDDDFTCGWYCNLCVQHYGAQANNPGLLSGTLMLGHGIMVHGYINGKLDRFLRHDTTWYDDLRDVLPDLIPDDSNSESGDSRKSGNSDKEKDGTEPSDLVFVNLGISDERNNVHAGFDQSGERGGPEPQEHNEANEDEVEDGHGHGHGDEDEDEDEDEDGEILQTPHPGSPKKEKTSMLRFHQATRDAANFPSTTCDRCDKTGKECHMDSYNRICAECDKQSKSCVLQGISCASLWKEYNVQYPGAKATWVSPVFASAGPERQSGKSQRKEANDANGGQTDVAIIAGGRENNKRKVIAGIDIDDEEKETKRAKGMTSGNSGNDA